MSIDRALAELPCVRAMGFKKRYWTPEEDEMLISYINKHGHGNWCALPKQAGLKRCGKSCRLRWRNYLRPDMKRGNFSLKEVQTIFELHQILGNRWSAIASHLPGRTDNEIKYVWNSYSKQRLMQIGTDPVTHALRGSSCYAAVSIQDNHREQADHDFQSHGCTPDSVKTVFKREGNSNESLSSQIKPLEEQGASNNWTFLIQKIPDDQNMINSEQLEAYYSLNSTGNSYSYSTDSPRLFSTKPMEIVSASPFGLCGAMDLKEQTNSEKLAAVIPFDYIKTSEEKMHIKTSEEKMLAMDYTSLLQSNYTDYIGCGKCQEDDKLVDGQQAYQEGNPAYDFSMLSNNVEFWRRELLLRPPTENNTLGDQTVAFSSSKDAAHVGGQQKSVKVESTGTNFSVEQFLEQADHNMGMGSNNIEGRSNIYDSWPDMILADRDQVMKYWVKLLGHVGPMPFLETISRVPDL